MQAAAEEVGRKFRVVTMGLGYLQYNTSMPTLGIGGDEQEREKATEGTQAVGELY